MITVNVGEMLEPATGGWFPSTTHRVVNPPSAANCSRYSMPMFFHPRPEVMLASGVSGHHHLEQRLREIGLRASDPAGESGDPLGPRWRDGRR